MATAGRDPDAALADRSKGAWQAGQKRARPMRAVEAIGMGGAGRGDDVGVLRRKLALPYLCGLPQFIIDNAQFGNFGGDPLVARVDAQDAPAGRRVLDVAEPVPDQPADVELVVDEPGAARRVAAQRRIRPQSAIGSGNALVVQALGDRAWADAGGEGAEDAADDLGLSLVDGALAADRLAPVSARLATS